jgi:glycosyltransferase involved in cell wall biosynthesis
MTIPAFSIVVPTYNRAHIIGSAIRSIQAQTMPDWELIVVDDGSADKTRAVLQKFARNDARIKVVSNAGRIGPAGARNTGIRASQAEAIAFLDSDDTWEPRTLESFLSARRRDPQAVLIGSDYRMLDETSGSASTMKSFLLATMLPWWENYPLAAAAIPLDLMRRDVHVITRPSILLSMTIAGFLWIQTSSAVVRRDAVFAAGLFNERLMRTEDIDLWLKLARLGRFVYLDEVLATYDITGRANAAGIRYQSYHRSRRHTAYTEALYHLRSLTRIPKTNHLDVDQCRLLKDRRIAHHHRCAVIALRERRVQGLTHFIACLTSKDQRERLLKRPNAFFRLP